MSIRVSDAHVAPSAEEAVATPRYPGAPPFRDTELDRLLFRGREAEADAVLHGILGSNLFLLYGESGLGKSSLMNAAVMERLRERGHWPVAVRLNDPKKPFVQLVREQLESAVREDGAVDLVIEPGFEEDDTSLWTMLSPLELWRGNDLQKLVIVFDQFEELFTLEWEPKQRRAFIEQFGEVIRGYRLRRALAEAEARERPAALPPDVRFVLLIREDALGELEVLARDAPQIMHNRFRLEPMTVEQAEAAIREPGLVEDSRLISERFSYSNGAVEVILDFLRQATRRGSAVSNGNVDPSQLQIVCQHLERQVVQSKRPRSAGLPIVIDSGDFGGIAGLRSVLGHFYRDVVNRFPGDRQKRVRDLCENGLVSRSGRRLSLEQGQITDEFKVTERELARLVDERLVRADARLDSLYYELSHDTLIEPILTYREEQRLAKHRRRRRWFAGVTGALVILLAALVVWIANRGEPAPTVLPLGVPVPATLQDGLGTSRFVVPGSRDTTRIVSVSPDSGSSSDLDLAVSVSSSSGSQDRAARGAAEVVVIPAGTETTTVDITETNGASGRASLILSTVRTRQILPDGDRLAGRIDEAGQLAVFTIDVSPGRSALVEVRPDDATDQNVAPQRAGTPSAKVGKPVQALDPSVELITPLGDAIEIDDKAPGEDELVPVGDESGTYTLVVRGVYSSGGSFHVDLTATDRTVTPDDPAPARVVVSESRSAVLSFQAADEKLYAVQANPRAGLGLSLEVIGPDDVVMEAQADDGLPANLLVGGGAGTYVLRVTGQRAIGSVDVTVQTVPTTSPLPVGTTSEGGLAADDAIGSVYLVEGGTPVMIAVEPEEGLDPVIEIAGNQSREIDAGSAGAMESVMLPSGTSAVRVKAYGRTSGSFRISAITARHLDRTSTTATTPALFEADVTDERDLLAFHTDIEKDEVAIQATYDGVTVDGIGTSVLLGTNGAGRYQILVTTKDAGRSFEASLSPVTPVPLVVGQVVTATTPAVLSLPSPRLPALEVAVRTGEGGQITLVRGSDVIDSAAARAARDEVRLVVDDTRGGDYRIIVTSDRPGATLTAQATPPPVRTIAPGENLTASPGTFEVEVPEDGLLAVTATPYLGRVEAEVRMGGQLVAAENPGDTLLSPTTFVVGAGGPGRYQLYIRTTVDGARFDLTVSTIARRTMTVGASLTATAPTEFIMPVAFRMFTVRNTSSSDIRVQEKYPGSISGPETVPPNGEFQVDSDRSSELLAVVVTGDPGATVTAEMPAFERA